MCRLKNKGAFLTLLWSFSTFMVILYPHYCYSSQMLYYGGVAIAVLPIAGWLADVCYGRYRVIAYALRLKFVVVVVYIAIQVVESYSNIPHLDVVKAIVAVFVAVGVTGVIANILSLGIDQMTDASSAEISSYIKWSVWIFLLANNLFSICTSCFTAGDSMTVTYLILPFVCALSLLAESFLNHWLVKEPVTHNPLKLIFQVLRYAAKNKYPRLRSAFTYWEDKPYSRIDLGKAKYGGPFTTEQVEDVKTFFRILVVLILMTLYSSVILFTNYYNWTLIYHFRNNFAFRNKNEASNHLMKCIGDWCVAYIGDLTVFVLIPVFCLCLNYKCIRLGIINKLIVGMFLLMLFQIALLTLEVVGLKQDSFANITCLLKAKLDDNEKGQALTMSYMWLIAPRALYTIAIYIISVSMVEFIISQGPYAMRGLLIGIAAYFFLSPFLFIQIAFQNIVNRISKHIDERCGVWFYVALVSVSMFLIVIGMVTRKLYSPRKREDNLNNEHMFAEYYYDKYLQ